MQQPATWTRNRITLYNIVSNEGKKFVGVVDKGYFCTFTLSTSTTTHYGNTFFHYCSIFVVCWHRVGHHTAHCHDIEKEEAFR